MRARPTLFEEFLSRNASSGALFLAGALLLPAFLLQRDIAVRGLEVALLFALNGMRGARIHVVQSLVLALGVVVFNLVIPVGRVLASPLGLPITEGALGSGLARASTVIGMIALSRFTIRSDLRLPGSLGGLIARSLYYFELIMAERKQVRKEHVLQDIDEILLSIRSGGHGGAAHSAEGVAAGQAAAGEAHPAAMPQTTAAGVVFLAALIAAAWAMLALTMLRPGFIWPR